MSTPEQGKAAQPTVTTPFVCVECKKLNKNWYAPCPHAPALSPSIKREALEATTELLEAHEFKKFYLGAGCKCGWRTQLMSESECWPAWAAHVAALRQGETPLRARVRNVAESLRLFSTSDSLGVPEKMSIFNASKELLEALGDTP